MVRVLMTADAVGGVWDYALDLASALSVHGVSVDLAVMGPSPDLRRRRAAQEAGVGLHLFDCRLEWMRDPEDDIARSGEWLLDLERSLGADIVHVNGYAHAVLPFDAPVLSVAHSCVLSWWRHALGTDAPADWRDYGLRVAEGLTAADIVVAPTRAMLADAAALYGPLPHGRVIHNGRDPGRFRSARKEPVVFSMGRAWDSAKNLKLLDAVAPRLAWPVELAGSLAHPEGGEAALPNLRCLGPLPAARVAERLSKAAIYTLPARYEPFGLSVLEAAMSGCALVLGDIASLRELWDGAALFVSPDDADALAGALDRLIRDEDLREDLAIRAVRRARNYTSAHMASDYLDAYHDLMRSPYAGCRSLTGRTAANAAPGASPLP
jgi:glycogen synthase